MAPALRLPFARGPDGALRWARERRRDEGCVCVGCGAPVVLRAGDVRRAHYAHATHAPCSGETALHRGTIEILALEIERASRDRRALLAPFACRDCDLVQMRNLGRLTELRALREHTLRAAPAGDGRAGGVARPDLTIVRGASRRPAYAVEVVVTHAPEPAAREVLAQLGLPVVIVRPTWDALTVLELPLASVSTLGEALIEGAPCGGWRHPPARGARCAACDREGLVGTVQRWSGAPCWRCGTRVPFVDVRVHDERAADDADAWDGQPLFGVDAIGEAAVAVASSLGVSLAERWTYRTGRAEIVHACLECGHAQARASRGTGRTPEAVVHASWCRGCRTLEPLGGVRERSS